MEYERIISEDEIKALSSSKKFGYRRIVRYKFFTNVEDLVEFQKDIDVEILEVRPLEDRVVFVVYKLLSEMSVVEYIKLVS